jgi:hypothetical protein
MAGLSLRDRFFTPRVARAMMSPSGILLAGGGVALGVVAGLPVAAAAVIGAGAWGVRVAAAMRPAQPGERIDPFTLNEPWRAFVQDALSARGRFREATERTRSGPLRDTLREIANRLEDGVNECWRIAKQGEALVQSRRNIQTTSIDREVAEAEKAAADRPDDQLWARTLESLRAQRATADRMDQVIEKARSELRLLDARMGEAVVRALELSAQTHMDTDSASSLSSDVEGMVTDLEALRQAVEETHGPGGSTSSEGGLYQDPATG